MPKSKYIEHRETNLIDEMLRQNAALSRRVQELERSLYKRNTYGIWIEPEWENGYAQVSDPDLEPFHYRLYTGGFPEFKGHIDVAGATSGTVAFTIPVGPGYMEIGRNVYDYTIVTDGVSFQTAMFHINANTGAVTLTWPAS